jgi:hypothetical protein
MTLSNEATQLEKIRQQIEDAEYESGNMSDYLDYGKPNENEKTQAEERMRIKNAEAAVLKQKLRELVQNTSRQVIEEWVNYHTSILQAILSENPKGANADTRKYVAQTTLEEWQSVLNGSRDYVSINWHFLKDYREKVRKTFNRGWFKLW